MVVSKFHRGNVGVGTVELVLLVGRRRNCGSQCSISEVNFRLVNNERNVLETRKLLESSVHFMVLRTQFTLGTRN
jgi:hypothetical protein